MNFPGTGVQQDMLKGCIATLVLFLTYVFIPLAGMLAGIFAPLPGMFYFLKSGRIAGYVIVACTTGILALAVDPATSVLYLVQAGVVSLVIPFCMTKGMGVARALTYGVAANLVLVVVLAMAYGLYQGVDLDRQVVKGIGVSISQTAKLYEKSGLSGEDLKSLQDGMQQAGVLIGRIYPALSVVFLAVIAGVNTLMLQRIAIRTQLPIRANDFARFKNPDQLIWVLIVTGFALLVPQQDVARVALNGLIVTLFMYFLQGMAVVTHWLARHSVPALFRIIFYFLLIMQPYLAVAISGLGIFDMWGNFRAPKQQNL